MLPAVIGGGAKLAEFMGEACPRISYLTSDATARDLS